ncbi:uncharacterized protein LOC135807208 [Sycon ciliatum]|uniref:uncharacterized protein LOC135807208 n=1 Tax=Sycon ciliatum TaxID=27933 RepID=UPI0031F6DE60
MAAEAGWQTLKSRKSKDLSVLACLEVAVPLPAVKRYDGHSFGTRSVLGHYSQDDDCAVHMDDREACEMAYKDCREFEKLKDKDLKGDLTEFKWRVEETEADGLKPLLKWILHKMRSEDVEVKKYMRRRAGEVTFVFKRSVMTRILNAPYDQHSELDKWKLKVCRFQNIIYVCNDREEGWEDYSDDYKERRYWAAKFESLMTRPINKDGKKLNDCAGYAIVVGTQIKIDKKTKSDSKDPPKISFILSAEVDAEQNGAHTKNATGGLPPATSDCIELKTAYVDLKGEREKNFRSHTLRKTWSQCWSVGTPSIVYGFLNEKGILQETKTFRTDDLPKLPLKHWSDAGCLNFVDDFTMWLVEEVKEELREYTVTYEPRGCEKETPRTSGKMLLRTVGKIPSILTREFVKEMERYRARS